MSDYRVVIEEGRWTVRWSAHLGGGFATPRDFATRDEAEAWVDGYEQGARENM